MEMSEKYRIHDNGGRPFEVSIDRAADRPFVTVGKHRDHDQDDCGPDCVYEPLVSWRYRQVWIGQGTDCPEDDQGAWTHGNTVLVQPLPDDEKKANTLVIIQSSIESFQLKDADEVVTRYSSRIGNSDVPYPYIETNKNVYLTLENVYAPIVPLQRLASEEAKMQGQVLNPDFTATESVHGPTWDRDSLRVVWKTQPVIRDFYNLYYTNKPNKAFWNKYPTHVIQPRLC